MTSLVEAPRSRGVSGGARAASIAREVFLGGRDVALADLARESNRRIAAAMESAGVDRSAKVSRWGTTAAALRWSDRHLEWAIVGDSAIVLVLADGSHRALAPVHDHDR